FFSSRRRHTRCLSDWSSDVCSSDLSEEAAGLGDLLSTQLISDDAHNALELARVRIPGQAFYLLRPDGHVGLAGTRLEPGAVARYLSESGIRTSGSTAIPRERGDRIALGA